MSICKYYTLFCVLKENFFSDLFAGLKPYRQYTEKASKQKSNYYLHYLSSYLSNYFLLLKTPVYLHFIARQHNLFDKALKYSSFLLDIIGLIKDIFCIAKELQSFFKT